MHSVHSVHSVCSVLDTPAVALFELDRSPEGGPTWTHVGPWDGGFASRHDPNKQTKGRRGSFLDPIWFMCLNVIDVYSVFCIRLFDNIQRCKGRQSVHPGTTNQASVWEHLKSLMHSAHRRAKRKYCGGIAVLGTNPTLASLGKSWQVDFRT